MKTIFSKCLKHRCWTEIQDVPKIIYGSLSCSYRNLPIIPLENATMIKECFYCHGNSLFSLDSLSLISRRIFSN
jgi:hypothetical protein